MPERDTQELAKLDRVNCGKNRFRCGAIKKTLSLIAVTATITASGSAIEAPKSITTNDDDHFKIVFTQSDAILPSRVELPTSHTVIRPRK
jgi:hypothetical protein